MIDTQLYEQLATAIIAKSFEDYICAHLIHKCVADTIKEQGVTASLIEADKRADAIINDCETFFASRLYKILSLNRRINNPVKYLLTTIETIDYTQYFYYNEKVQRVCKRKQFTIK